MTDMNRDTMMQRLLGTEQPELSCDACFEELDRYVEAELGGGDADAAVPGMRAHLDGCRACAEDHASLLEYVRAERRSRT